MENNNETKVIYKKSSTSIVIILLLIAGFCFFTYFSFTKHQEEINRLNYKCTPVTTNGEEKQLDLDSTIVLDLYNKVSTNIREDLATVSVIDDNLKLYLAFRQIPNSKFYNSNCNLFNATSMLPYTCNEGEGFVPKAFKEEALKLELLKLYGDDVLIANNNIQLGASCIGGYQYIEKRGEYVQGECSNLSSTTYRVEKKLVKAVSKDGRVFLTEDVRYYGNEGKDLPDHLKNGKYTYVFKLDMNYNYIFIDKIFEK